MQKSSRWTCLVRHCEHCLLQCCQAKLLSRAIEVSCQAKLSSTNDLHTNGIYTCSCFELDNSWTGRSALPVL